MKKLLALAGAIALLPSCAEEDFDTEPRTEAGSQLRSRPSADSQPNSLPPDAGTEDDLRGVTGPVSVAEVVHEQSSSRPKTRSVEEDLQSLVRGSDGVAIVTAVSVQTLESQLYKFETRFRLNIERVYMGSAPSEVMQPGGVTAAYSVRLAHTPFFDPHRRYLAFFGRSETGSQMAIEAFPIQAGEVVYVYGSRIDVADVEGALQ